MRVMTGSRPGTLAACSAEFLHVCLLFAERCNRGENFIEYDYKYTSLNYCSGLVEAIKSNEFLLLMNHRKLFLPPVCSRYTNLLQFVFVGTLFG